MKSFQGYLRTLQFTVCSLAASAEDMASLTGTRTHISGKWARHYRLIAQFLVTLVLFGTLLAFGGRALGGVTASISGTVKDSSGSLVAGATVIAKNTDTGIAQSQRTNAQGYYSFRELPLGHYDVQVEQTGFKTFRQIGLVLDVNAEVVVDVTLEVGQVSEKVEVRAEAVHVETATTQMGEVIPGSAMTAVPLNGRAYTDLLALQPGVSNTATPLTGSSAGAYQSAGFALAKVSGSEDTGGLSVNGMREAANGYMLNGLMVQEAGFGGTSVVPNLDSLAEFRIITNNFDPEYGNSAGGQINVITKSGANEFHGDAFEFVRNTDFDAAKFFDNASGSGRGAWHQNQFGGTFGGPIKREKAFFFADYQGNRMVQGKSSGLVSVPTSAELAGNFSALAADMTGSVNSVGNGPTSWAGVLSSRLGYTVQPGEAYSASTCVTTDVTLPNHCVFPGAIIPREAFDPVSNKILALGIFPANTTGTFDTSAFPIRLNDNKTSGRVDINSRLGLVSTYYYYDKYNRNDPYWPASFPILPGFDVTGAGQTHVANIGDTKLFGSTAVNEFRLGYVRYVPSMNSPKGGTAANESLSALGFASGASGAPGILPLSPIQGVPEIDFNNFTVGISSRIVTLFENSYQASDNFSKVSGTHTFKFGGGFRYTQLTENLSNVANGAFGFGGKETGIDFADFLLGAPTVNSVTGTAFLQGFAPASYGRNRSGGVFAQDSWRVRANLTLNYGVRWDVSTPWKEKHNEIQTLVPGEQSVVYPNSPPGWVFPGDRGIPSTLAPTHYRNFAPRVGLAYSPGAGGFLGKLLGAGQSSIRAGYGMFYSTFEGVTNFNEIGDAPFGNFRSSFTPDPGFDAPWTDRPSGTAFTNPFPVPPLTSSINFAATGFIPIASSPGFFSGNRLPYAEHYELSFQRQFLKSTLLTVSYVGTQAHHLLSDVISDPGSPAICAALNVLGATPSCGPGGENTMYVLPAGATPPPGTFPFTGTLTLAGTPIETCPGTSTCVPGTRLNFNPAFFGPNGYFITIGNSVYNSGQVSLRHSSSYAQFLVAYTFSKSLDDASGYGEQINPFNARLSRGLSAFDITHNFVANYTLRLPLNKVGGPRRLVEGWALSGITRFSTGVPISLVDGSDNSELGSGFTGPQTLTVDTPQFVGPLGITNPRKVQTFIISGVPVTGNFFFNPTAFTPSPIGQEGNAARRFFHGPGINNWDMALLKDTTLTERTKLEFRAEFFNIFNHAQFLTPSGILGSNFGTALDTQDPRVGQLSLKLLF